MLGMKGVFGIVCHRTTMKRWPCLCWWVLQQLAPYSSIPWARPFPRALLLLLTLPAQAATVLSVGDGDTLRVDDHGKRLTIRLACIDAPEMA